MTKRLLVVTSVAAWACGGMTAPNTVPPPPPPPPPPTSTVDTLVSSSLTSAAQIPAGATWTGSFSNGYVVGRGDRMLIPQAGNIDLNRGTLEVVYTPHYNADDGNAKRDVFGTGLWLASGAIVLGKHNSSNQSGMYVQLHDNGLVEGFIANDDQSPTGYDWVNGQTVTIRMVWDFTQTALPHVRVWLDGRELPWTVEHNRTPRSFTSNPTGQIFLGGRDPTHSGIWGDGVYRDLLILSEPVGPTP